MTRITERRTWHVAAVLACILAIVACCLTGCSAGSDSGSSESVSASATSQQARTVTDVRGRSVDIPQDVQKIVCVGVTLRPVCYLQAQDMVVGVEEAEHNDNVTCAYRHVNQSTFADLPIIGKGGSGGVTPNEEAIVAAKPDVIIADGLEVDEADALQQKTGIPVVCLDQPETFFDDDYFKNLTFLGEVLNKQDRAQEVIDYIKGIKSDLQKRAEASSSYNSVSAYAAGISYRGGHGFDGTEANFPPFAACGIANVADGQGANGPFTIDVEAIAAAQPDYVFVESGNISLVADDYKANPDFFNSMKAVQNDQVYSLIAYRFYSTNVELALANCYQVASVVYPDTFGDIDATQKLDEISEFMLGAPIADDLAAAGAEFKKLDLASM